MNITTEEYYELKGKYEKTKNNLFVFKGIALILFINLIICVLFSIYVDNKDYNKGYDAGYEAAIEDYGIDE